jgi:hypothetical protein
MPKDIATTSNNPVLAPRLPGWLEDLCEQQHPDVPWQVPAKLPPRNDLLSAIAEMERLIRERVTPAYAKQCIAQLMVAFEPNTKLSADETRLRAMVWIEANGDLCDGLWREATQECIRTLKWMPKPSEFRAAVEHRVTSARRYLDKLKAMLEAHNRPAEQFQPEPRVDRLRGDINRWRKFGDCVMGRDLKATAIRSEIELAALENREPADWAVETKSHSATAEAA